MILTTKFSEPINPRASPGIASSLWLMGAEPSDCRNQFIQGHFFLVFLQTFFKGSAPTLAPPTHTSEPMFPLVEKL